MYLYVDQKWELNVLRYYPHNMCMCMQEYEPDDDGEDDDSDYGEDGGGDLL